MKACTTQCIVDYNSAFNCCTVCHNHSEAVYICLTHLLSDWALLRPLAGATPHLRQQQGSVQTQELDLAPQVPTCSIHNH